LQLALSQNFTKPKVDDLQVRGIILSGVQEVLWLKVSMHDVLRVAVVECHKDHLESSGGQLFIEVLVFHNSVEQFPALAELSHQVHVGVVFKVFKQLDHVRMVL
jgi:hypothetical protein